MLGLVVVSGGARAEGAKPVQVFLPGDVIHGLRIGIVNIIRGKDSLPVLPIVNWKF